jgi:hypothetical protein
MSKRIPVIDAMGTRRCRTCEHWHHPDPRFDGGVCILNPPTAFIVGFGQSPIQIPELHQGPMPIVRAFFPPAAPQDGCHQWSVRLTAEGSVGVAAYEPEEMKNAS